MPIRTTARALLLSGAISMLLSVGGCAYNEGGPGYSGDIHTYVSTAWRPWTVTLIDTRTGEAVWSADIPVDQQLVIRFRSGKGPSPELPDMMDWGLMEAGTNYGHRNNRLPVPGADARLLRPTLRPAPEMPGALLTKAPDTPDEILETTPYQAPAEEMGGMPEEYPDEAPVEEGEGAEEAPIDLPGAP